MAELVKAHPFIPITYGTESKPFETPAANEHTHSWTVFLRSPDNKDLSVVIKKVVFKLHDSFHNPSRAIETPPYEVTESGWGEFEIQIRVYLHDAKEKPITAFHLLKLYPNDDTKTTPDGKVVSETYDEVVIPNAGEAVKQSLTSYLSAPPLTTPPTTFSDWKAVEAEQLKNLTDCRKFYTDQIEKQKAELAALTTAARTLKGESQPLEPLIKAGM